MKEDSLRRGSLWMFSGQAVSILFQGIYFVLMGRTLGSREYGVFIGVVSLVGTLANFSALGMEMILVRNVSRDRESFAVTWGQSLIITFAGFLVLLATSLLIGHYTLRPDLRVLIPYAAFADGLLGKLVLLAARAFQGAGHLDWTAKLTAVTNIGRALTAAGLFWYAHALGVHPTALTWAKIYWFSTLIVAVGALIVVTTRLGRPRISRIRGRDLSEGFSFSLSSSSISIYNDIDKTFLAGLNQLSAAGFYSAAYRVIDVVTAPLYGLYAAAMPRFFREGGRGGIAGATPLVRKLLLRTVPYGIVAAIGLYLGAGVLPLLFGPSFRGSVTVLRWLCLLPLLRVLHYAWGTAITASASQWNRTATQLSAALLNLSLDAVLIPRWSWKGAAIASLATDGTLALLSWIVLQMLARRERSRLAASLDELPG
ncbi:lipopolysaccharide biosynthesis protein [Paracidobacterium acidisoli]|uniref:Lipopolysaccharide biosynthesis protein n=1 Tax=Paracidobacterium acidisoli TaxID=2303751 RepID=A0A372IT63_9BACT|nr:oligosaccharide flippase family protein [Paracidobacterium acidisoli]MBT9329475.1 oligosaccharide flippase family protein [Paracidobacterium acidisoli]